MCVAARRCAGGQPELLGMRTAWPGNSSPCSSSGAGGCRQLGAPSRWPAGGELQVHYTALSRILGVTCPSIPLRRGFRCRFRHLFLAQGQAAADSLAPQVAGLLEVSSKCTALHCTVQDHARQNQVPRIMHGGCSSCVVVGAGVGLSGGVAACHAGPCSKTKGSGC